MRYGAEDDTVQARPSDSNAAHLRLRAIAAFAGLLEGLDVMRTIKVQRIVFCSIRPCRLLPGDQGTIFDITTS